MSANHTPSKVWLIRAGRHGEDEDTALAKGLAIIGFQEVGDLTSFKKIEEIVAAVQQVDSKSRHNEHRALNYARQLWAFRSGIQPRDTAVLPLKLRSGQIALGLVEGPYQYIKINGQQRHTRKVNWLKPDVARSVFKEDLLYSFGAFMTVCRITRHNATSRVASVLSGKPDPGYEELPQRGRAQPEIEATDSDAQIDLGQAAHDEIVAFVRGRFPGHELARLVDAVLQAEGYITHRAPPGPDGGADILCGRGPLGLDSPTLCVQVKATESTADVKLLRELIGTMDTFKANQGLLVCWGGFTQPLKNEARQNAFKVRLWDQSDLVQAIYRTYERLSPEIQAELPLKRSWMLVREDADE